MVRTILHVFGICTVYMNSNCFADLFCEVKLKSASDSAPLYATVNKKDDIKDLEVHTHIFIIYTIISLSSYM